MNDKPRVRLLAPLSLVGLAIVPQASLAFEYSATIGYEGEYQNNAARAAEGSEEEDFIHRPRFEFVGNHVGGAFELGLQYRAYRRMYQDDTFDGETVLEGSGDVTWNAVPGRLIFTAGNRRQETRIRVADEDVPTNLQETDESRAGVDLILDSFSNHQFILGYQYSEIHLAETENDSGRHSGTATYAIPLSATDTVSLVGTVSKVEFDRATAEDYETRTGALQYSRTTVNSTVDLSAGYQTVDRDFSPDEVDGFVGSISFTRQLSLATTIGASYSQDFRDNSLGYGALLPVDLDDFGGPNPIGDTDVSQVYKEKRGAVFLNTRVGVNAINVSAFAARRDYQDDDATVGARAEDTETYGALFNVSRAIRENLHAGLGLGYSRHDFPGQDDVAADDDDEFWGHANLSWQRSPRLTMGLEFRYFARARDESTQGDVDDWSAAISIDYLLMGTAQR